MQDRPSILDVFENFLGVGIEKIDSPVVEQLTTHQRDELLQQIDLF